MKKFEITARGEDCVTKTQIVNANNYDEALDMAWELFHEYDSLYVSEMKS